MILTISGNFWSTVDVWCECLASVGCHGGEVCFCCHLLCIVPSRHPWFKGRRKKQVPWATTLYFRGVQSKQASITRAKYMCLNTISSCYYFYRKENNFSSLKNTIVSQCSCYLFLQSLLFSSLSNPISNRSGCFLHNAMTSIAALGMWQWNWYCRVLGRFMLHLNVVT